MLVIRRVMSYGPKFGLELFSAFRVCFNRNQNCSKPLYSVVSTAFFLFWVKLWVKGYQAVQNLIRRKPHGSRGPQGGPRRWFSGNLAGIDTGVIFHPLGSGWGSVFSLRLRLSQLQRNPGGDIVRFGGKAVSLNPAFGYTPDSPTNAVVPMQILHRNKQ